MYTGSLAKFVKSFILKGVFLFLIICSSSVYSQTDSLIVDTAETQTVLVKTKNPKAAALMSAIVPGLGQAYNEKYWKVPVVFAALGTIGYFAYKNNGLYKDFEQAHLYLTDTIPSTNILAIQIMGADYDASQAKIIEDVYHRDRDFMIVLFAGVYMINIIDATVDAHLFDYDISEDLSLRFRPVIFSPNQHENVLGLRCSLTFK